MPHPPQTFERSYGPTPSPTPPFVIERDPGPRRPLMAVALHHGHAIRPEVAALLQATERDRLREEDPHSGCLCRFAPLRVTVLRSRFEVDLNRPREAAVYRTPEEAFGLELFRSPLPGKVTARSLAQWDAFYAALRNELDRIAVRHGRFLVLDVHTYNHRRRGPDGPSDPPDRSPDINLGTGSLDRRRFGRVSDAFLSALREGRLAGRPLQVGENVRFRGGFFPTWVNRTWPGIGCALAIEVKKVFMDEWTGEVDGGAFGELSAALAGAVAPALAALHRAR